MATTMVNFRLDEEDKKGMEMVCNEIGLSMSAAFSIFAKKVRREKRIPFDLSIDPFYSEENLQRLTKAIEDAKAGRNMSEHELIEVD
ncbi:MAG: type II toxin-antitoxin system RelB/DinJ family antitoxin [Firmicutes bacterium]|nr:type II toxin-antitoxin system RelB/DinJ family antitoxin [Candidatus Colivicinus equi]